MHRHGNLNNLGKNVLSIDSSETKSEAQVPAQQVQTLLRDRETLSQQVI